MLKRFLPVLVLLAIVIAAPLVLRKDTQVATAGTEGDRLVIMTPHNDSIRKEFGEAFAAWWMEKTGRPVFVDWRAPGGGGDIKRMIAGAFEAAAELGKEGTEFDIFFGGGSIDFIEQAKAGRLARLEVFEERPEWFSDDRIPAKFSGENYYDPEHRWVGVCVSQFGIVYNKDVLMWDGIPAPQRWADLADPAYFGKLALADPTKSGSVTKAFEMIVQEQMQAVIREQGDSAMARAEGWKRGLNLLQDLAANARYFTDSASKIPHDVASGNAAAGTSIDFYGRTFEESVRDGDGESRVRWTAPDGGGSLSVDPIAVFRGAPNMEVAQAFVIFCLSEEGQLLWNLKPGTPGGPKDRALRRLPVRRDLYTPENLRNFSDPDALPYERTGEFIYRPELTGPAFSVLRSVFRAMCMDPHQEMKEAWEHAAVGGGGGLEKFHDISIVDYDTAMNELVPLFRSKDALAISRRMTSTAIDFRDQYRAVSAGKGGTP